MDGFGYRLGGGRQFDLYRHPFRPGTGRVVRVGEAVVTVADGSDALAINSLQEPYVHLTTRRAQPFTLCAGDARSYSV